MKLTNVLKILFMLVLSTAILISCQQGKKQDPITVTSDMEEAFNKAISSIFSIDENTKSKLESDYITQHGEALSLNNYNAKLGELITGSICYGEYENCVIVFRTIDSNVKMTKVIGGVEFKYDGSFALEAYCNGEFYKLDIAYHYGHVTRDQILAAAEVHNNILEYNKLITEASE